MGSVERSKKKTQLWQKAIVHFLVCFVMGFFSGTVPTGKSSFLTSQVVASYPSEFSPKPVELSLQNVNQSSSNDSLVQIPKRPDESSPYTETSNKQKEKEEEEKEEEEEEEEEYDDLNAKRLVIIVTPTSAKDKFRGLLLNRLANTLKLVPSPLLWVVVEQQSESSYVSEILRKTGVMYRHLVFKENISDPEAEMDHQRNVALNHIEHHRLSGIVHFAGLANVYDLSFFNEISATEGFGTWPIAFLSANRNRVIIEGPVCDSSEVIGWHLRRRNNNLTDAKPPIHISSFAFNSSVLWDPERWGRPSSVQDNSQNSVKFVEKEVLEEETKLKGIPSEGCSKVLLWNLHIPIKTTANVYQ